MNKKVSTVQNMVAAISSDSALDLTASPAAERLLQAISVIEDAHVLEGDDLAHAIVLIIQEAAYLIENGISEGRVLKKLLSLGLSDELLTCFYEKAKAIQTASSQAIADQQQSVNDEQKTTLQINPEYAIDGTFSIVRSLRVKTFAGLWRSFKPLDLPSSPAIVKMLDNEMDIDSRYCSRAMLQLAWLKEGEGRTFFHAYISALQTFVKKYQSSFDGDSMSLFLLPWTCDITVFDDLAPDGKRQVVISDWDNNFPQLQELVNEVLSMRRSTSSLILMDENELNGKYSGLYSTIGKYSGLYSTIAYLAIKNQKVMMHYYDFNDESTEDAYTVLHKVEFDYAPFAKRLALYFEEIERCIRAVARTINFSLHDSES